MDEQVVLAEVWASWRSHRSLRTTRTKRQKLLILQSVLLGQAKEDKGNWILRNGADVPNHLHCGRTCP